MNLRWRGRPERFEPQVANAGWDSDWDMAPASEAPKARTLQGWAAVTTGTDPAPLIWEDGNEYGERPDQGF